VAEVTNYIDRLAAELCPEGVEYRPLGEIADVTSGYVFRLNTREMKRAQKIIFRSTR